MAQPWSGAGPNLVPVSIVLRSEVTFRFVRSVFWVHPGGCEFRQIPVNESFFCLKLIEIETDNHATHVRYDRVRDMYHFETDNF